MSSSEQRKPGHRDRGQLIGVGLRWTSNRALQIVLIAAGCWVVGYVLGRFWSIILPVVLALFVTSVLWPLTAWLRRHHWRPALAAAAVLLAGLAVVGGVVAWIIPSVLSQAGQIADRTSAGLTKIETWLTGPPFNLGVDQISGAVDSLTSKLQSSASSIAAGVFAGVTSALSLLITMATAVALVFFFLKDGPRFLPWMQRSVGQRIGHGMVPGF